MGQYIIRDKKHAAVEQRTPDFPSAPLRGEPGVRDRCPSGHGSTAALALQKNKNGQIPSYPSIIQIVIEMPTIKNISGPYRFFFYSFDCNEQMHVHVQRERMICKFWLEPVVLVRNQGYTPKELNTIRETIRKNRHKIMEAWYEHCGATSGSEN